MRAYEELKKDAHYRKWILDEVGNINCPDGENKEGCKNRISKGLTEVLRIMEKEEKEIGVVVCHGGTIAYLMDKLFPFQQHFYKWQPAPGEGYLLEIKAQHVANYTPVIWQVPKGEIDGKS